MAGFRVDDGYLQAGIDAFTKLLKRVNFIKERVQRVGNSLDWDIKGEQQLDRKIGLLVSDLGTLSERIKIFGNCLSEIKTEYNACRTDANKLVQELPAEVIGAIAASGDGSDTSSKFPKTNAKKNKDGQASGFTGYGGIEDPAKYMDSKYGSGWIASTPSAIPGIENFLQSSLEPEANNCTLASIARVMKYYSDKGYKNIPSDIKEIYRVVKDIGVKHGYDPKKTGLLRDLFVYTPWEIDNMVSDAWEAFGYPKGEGNNDYFNKLETIKSNVGQSSPLLLNIASGDYECHTVTVTGYQEFTKDGKDTITLLQVYDGRSETIRYIDWKEFGGTWSNITRFIAPPK
ncbi:MAG TPA: hypothetical protein VHT96_18500 [Clostridia bacterium]|nr:hypothetical protein [Clostridia bacterium]